MTRESLADDYPTLFGPLQWGVVRVEGFVMADTLPERGLIQSVNLVPFVGDRCVVVEVEGGRLTLPGGTREPGESLLETAQRELMEEAGATITALRPLGSWSCHSESATPWRPFLAHPDYHRVVLCGDVSLTQSPSNPADGEQIARVRVVDPADAVALFSAASQRELADLYALATRVRSTCSLDPDTRARFDAAMSAK